MYMMIYNKLFRWVKKYAFASLGLVLVSVYLSGCTPSQEHRLNLILVTFDTARADHISAYGYQRIRTSFIDEVV